MNVTDLKEIDETTSSDDIKAYAEQVVSEVEQDRSGDLDSKSDAQIASELAGKTNPADETTESSAENNSGNESAQEGEETGNTQESQDWLNDDVKAEATAYGIDESELADFASREELDRALRLFDKTALEAGRKAMVDGKEESPARNERGQFAKKEEPSSDTSEEEAQDDGRYKVSLDSELYDEEIVKEFTQLRDHYDSRLAALEERFAEESASAEERRFDGFVDSLGHTDLFGKTGEESDKELERRRDLNVAVKAQMIGLEKLGRPTQLTKQLISRVTNMVFADELSKKKLKQQTSKISKQSNMRQGGSPTKPIPPKDDARDEADRLYKELAGA